MKLRSTLATLFLLPALLVGCSDDPSGPVDEIYSVQSVTVDGASRTLPGVLYQGPATCGVGITCDLRYELRRATLLLRVNGRYEFSGSYLVTETSSPPKFSAFSVGAIEDGTYTRSGETITFTATSSSASSDASRYLQTPGTLQNGSLSIRILDPLFEEDIHTYSFSR